MPGGPKPCRFVVYHALAGYGAGVPLTDQIRSHQARAVRFIRHDLWSPQTWSDANTRNRWWLLVGRTAYLIWAGFSRERLRLRAAALTYMTLLSLVPALAVVFAVFAGFKQLGDARERLKGVIVEFLSVTHQDAVTQYLDKFVGSVGALGGVSVVILLFTTLTLLANIEKSFNDIWGLKEDRSVVRRFMAYWPLLTLAPLLLGVSLGLSAKLGSDPTAQAAIEMIPGARLAVWLAPIVFTWMGFALMYIVMPNTRVPVRYALIGGIVGGSLWEIAKRLFGIYASRAITYSAIYGSLGVVPLSIIWIYVSWLVALIGAVVTFASQNAKTYEPHEDETLSLSAVDREHIAIRILLIVFERFEVEQGATPTSLILATVPGPPRAKRNLLGELEDGGLLVALDDQDAYLPGRPAHRTTLADALRVTRQFDASIVTTDDVQGGMRRASQLIDDEHERTFTELDRVSIAQLLADQAKPADEVVGAEAVEPEPATTR